MKLEANMATELGAGSGNGGGIWRREWWWSLEAEADVGGRKGGGIENRRQG